MLQDIRTAWQLFRLVRVVDRRHERNSASIAFVVEGLSSSSYATACEAAELHGLPQPARREGVEVSVWLDNATSGKVHRGHTLADALEKALRAV